MIYSGAARAAQAIGPGFYGAASLAGLGYLAYSAETAFIEKKVREQLAAMDQILRDQDKRANDLYHAALRRRKEAEAAEKKYLEEQQRARDLVESSMNIGPGSYARAERDLIAAGEKINFVPPILVPAAAGAPQLPKMGHGTRQWYVYPVAKETQRQLGVAAAQKSAWYTRAAQITQKLFKSKTGKLIGAAAFLAPFVLSPGKKKAAPEFLDLPLTDFQDQGALSGELGGVPAFDTAPETGTAGDKCEKVDPRREPGQCRQGWFSETPEKLYLKEWSRRPCQ